jgi:RNA polymerase sigma-54 factor
MVSLQPKLNLKVTQKQILTPGLVQMVSVLALNKLELRDMIQAEMVENPVLEELEDSVPVLDEVARRDEEPVAASEDAATGEKKDAFEEIDFGSFFRDYLDPGYRSPDLEAVEKPSFENFLSKPSTLTDHLMWQLGAMIMRPEVREAAELIIGNLDEDGYLTATEEELLAAAVPPSNRNGTEIAGPRTTAETGNSQKTPAQVAPTEEHPGAAASIAEPPLAEGVLNTAEGTNVALDAEGAGGAQAVALLHTERHSTQEMSLVPPRTGPLPLFSRTDLHEAVELVRQMDPVGVASRDLRECLLAQLKYHQGVHERQKAKTGQNGATDELLRDATVIVGDHLRLVQNKQTKELAKAIGRPVEAVQTALDFIKTLDPRPGQRYNKVEARLIEPDVAFIKQGDEYLVVLNDDDVPQLRLNPTYRRLLNRDEAEKDVRSYIKEKYKSAIQLIKNIEQRKQTILKVCYAIIGRQREFLDKGIDFLMPMMIKEVAEEIGVHPSTVSRAVASKYAHTPQGVFELRFFFSESVQGPEGGNTSLLILKRRVKKLIEDEDPARPYTDEQITRILQSQGIQVTRRTVAKYREDMRIPSTHQRRVKN